jgi:hypothetical protein
MKRLIAAAALTSVALSASALEIGKPFEQLDLDRARPNIEFAPVEPYVADSRAPYEELVIDRTLPNINVVGGTATQFAAAAGSTVSDASNGGEVSAESPWANDWNFIAPAP